MKTILLIIIIFILLLGAGLGGYYYGYLRGYKVANEIQAKKSVPEVVIPEINPVENLPETNPFKEVKINPFEGIYENPFK